MDTNLKIKVCQFVYGYLEKPDSWFSQFAEPINRMYCELHGYDYIVDRLNTVRPDRHGNWEKVPHIHRNLTDCDWLFFFDADAVFYSHAIALHEELLHRLEPQHLMMFTADCGCEEQRWFPDKPNAGAGLFRNTQEVRDIVAEWNTVSDMPGYEHTRWKWALEQKALADYIFPKYRDMIKLLKNYYIAGAIHGQFIRHLIGSNHSFAAFEKIYHSPLMARNRKLAEKVDCSSQGESN
jgi:hypothetical protein